MFGKTIFASSSGDATATSADTWVAVDTPSELGNLTSASQFGPSATVKLTVSKTIPASYLNTAGDTLKVDFHVAGALGSTNDFSLTFSNGGLTTLSHDLPGLSPDTYTVTETGQKFCNAQNTCTTITLLHPVTNPIVVDLIPQNGSMANRCAGTAAFENVPGIN